MSPSCGLLNASANVCVSDPPDKNARNVLSSVPDNSQSAPGLRSRLGFLIASDCPLGLPERKWWSNDDSLTLLEWFLRGGRGIAVGAAASQGILAVRELSSARCLRLVVSSPGRLGRGFSPVLEEIAPAAGKLLSACACERPVLKAESALDGRLTSISCSLCRGYA